MTGKQREGRFGLGQLAGTLGLALVAISVSLPWLRLSLPAAFRDALHTGKVPAELSGQILFVASNGKGVHQAASSPAVSRLDQAIGIESTGFSQDTYLAVFLLVAALLALVGIVRSLRAQSAYGARRNSPLLAFAGIGSLIAGAVELWVLAQVPRSAMRPDTGLWVLAAGALLLLLGALTLGNNRRRPFLDDLDADRPMKTFDNTEHLAYSHGAWVPQESGDQR